MKKKLLSLVLACVLIFATSMPAYATTAKAPTIIGAMCYGDYVSIVWEEVEHDYNEYAVYRSTERYYNYKFITATDARFYEDFDIENNETYYYMVVIKLNGQEIQSMPQKVSTAHQTSTEKPKLFTFADNSKYPTQSIGLCWDSVDGADIYIIWRATKKNGKYKPIAEVWHENIYHDTFINIGKRYYYKVQALCIDDDTNTITLTAKSPWRSSVAKR